MAKTISHGKKSVGGDGSGHVAHKQVMTSPSPVSTAKRVGVTPPSPSSPSSVQRVGVTGPGATGNVGSMKKKGC